MNLVIFHATKNGNAPNGDAKFEAAAKPGERLAVIRETLTPCLAAFRRR